jgi:hypothetical protein
MAITIILFHFFRVFSAVISQNLNIELNHSFVPTVDILRKWWNIFYEDTFLLILHSSFALIRLKAGYGM